MALKKIEDQSFEFWHRECLVFEEEMYEKVIYTLPVVPRELADACVKVAERAKPPSYETMSKCLDYELANLDRLPSNSATLEKNGHVLGIFWTLAECQKHRIASGGVCIVR